MTDNQPPVYTIRDAFILARSGRRPPEILLFHAYIFQRLLNATGDDLQHLKFLFPFHAQYFNEFLNFRDDQIPENKNLAIWPLPLTSPTDIPA